MADHGELVQRFDQARAHLRAVAYRMLGSAAEADDAVQETWLRASRAGAGEVGNVTGWLTTIVSRICLDMLRARQRRGEEPMVDRADDRATPEDEAVLADSVGLALLVVLDRLGPDERVAFVLHDLFTVPFAQIAGIVDRTPDTTKRLASRARQKVRGTTVMPIADVARQRQVVDAFLTASRAGDLNGLLEVLAPDVVRRADPVALRRAVEPELRGAGPVARDTRTYAGLARYARPALVDGELGVVVAPRGRLLLALRLTIDAPGRISAIEVIGDPVRLRQLRLAAVP